MISAGQIWGLMLHVYPCIKIPDGISWICDNVFLTTISLNVNLGFLTSHPMVTELMSQITKIE